MEKHIVVCDRTNCAFNNGTKKCISEDIIIITDKGCSNYEHDYLPP